MQLWQDIRYGVRTLRKSPGFSLTAIATLALGIGATTANFSVCDAMLWKPLPLPNLSRLAMVLQRVPGDPNDWRQMAPADLVDIQQQQAVFEGVAAWDDELCNLAGNGAAPERASRYMVTPNFFALVGAQPALGRTFAPDEDQPGHEHVVVLSDALWRRRFAADSAIVGRDIRIDDEDYRVIGVMPHKFVFPMTSELWTPLALTPAERNGRASLYLSVMGLLKPGRTVSQAEAEVETIASRLAREYPDTNKERRFFSMGAHDFLIGTYTHQYSIMMFVSVLFVLLIACGNVANLQFARALGRSREVAVRAALGAGRGRLIAQYLTESLTLSLVGAGLGLVIASWDIQAILAGMPAEVAKYIPGWYDIRMDQRTLLFTLLAAVASGLLAGLVPAWQGTRSNLHDALKEGGRSASAGRGRARLRAVLVAAEIALSMVLLVGASLMIRGTGALLNNSQCFEPATLLTLRLSITENRYPKSSQQAAFYRQVVERVEATPGVRTAFAVKCMPYSGHYYGRRFTIENRVPVPGNQPAALFQVVSPNYFSTMHVPLRQGRFLIPSDGPDNQHVAVISEYTARHWWPGEPAPIGKRFQFDLSQGSGEWVTIVGVVADVPREPFERGPSSVVYVPLEQFPQAHMDFGVRTAGDPRLFAFAVVKAIHSADPEEPITGVLSFEDLAKHETLGLIYVAVIMGFYGLVALILSSVGVYGVMSYLVSQQTHDIGVRVALGASQPSVLAMVFRRGLITVVGGMAVGLTAAYFMTRLLALLIFGVPASDPATFVGIPLVLLAAAALAIYIPARRATSIDPIVALRYE
ncbi:MAG: ABC transporter permease [Bryobacteraceae bacterium]